jgi:hypothetical protein
MRLYVPNLLRDIVAGGAAAAYGVGYADGSALLHTDASAFTLGTDPIQSQIIQALKRARISLASSMPLPTTCCPPRGIEPQ